MISLAAWLAMYFVGGSVMAMCTYFATKVDKIAASKTTNCNRLSLWGLVYAISRQSRLRSPLVSQHVLDVPKRWFTHFYLLGFMFNCICIFVCWSCIKKQCGYAYLSHGHARIGFVFIPLICMQVLDFFFSFSK